MNRSIYVCPSFSINQTFCSKCFVVLASNHGLSCLNHQVNSFPMVNFYFEIVKEEDNRWVESSWRKIDRDATPGRSERPRPCCQTRFCCFQVTHKLPRLTMNLQLCQQWLSIHVNGSVCMKRGMKEAMLLTHLGKFNVQHRRTAAVIRLIGASICEQIVM